VDVSTGRALRFAVLSAVVALAVTRPPVAATRDVPQTPSFRASADLIAVDVQVVERTGLPVRTLTKDDFRVSIDRRRRTVANAEFIAVSPTAEIPTATAVVPAVEPARAGTPEVPGRTFIIAVDLLTFDIGSSRAVATAARQFVEKLRPEDRVGLFPYPIGPRIDASTDRARVLAVLDQLVGQRQTAGGRYTITSADIVDWWAGEQARIQARECSSSPTGRGGAINQSCVSELTIEVNARTQEHEAQAMLSNQILRRLFESLAPAPGRKFVVLVSGGMPMSDRPGGRPDGGTAATDLGTIAARSNIGLYALYLDSSFLERFSASTRGANRAPVNVERDSTVSGNWLSQVSDAAGGALMKVLFGNGEVALDRVLRETSAYYLLGVQPEGTDRDGKPHAIEVTVAPRGLTVRSRRWVVMPAAAAATP
jgi:VWFA-related protein